MIQLKFVILKLKVYLQAVEMNLKLGFIFVLILFIPFDGSDATPNAELTDRNSE